jgi:hypothetical protein
MKSFLLIGGLVGFGIGFAFSWVQENAWPSILFHACLGAYLGGFLLRWWGRAWLKGLESAITERRTQLSAPRLTSTPKASKT